MLCEVIPKKHANSKIKQLCCGDEFSDYKAYVSKPLASTQVIASGQMKRDFDNA